MNSIQFKFFLGFFLSFIVIFASLLFTIIYWDYRDPSIQEESVLGEPSPKPVEQETEIVAENSLDRFMQKFLNGKYKVKDSGSFGYIYDETEDGLISLDEGEDDTYFEEGHIVYFDAKEEKSVFWQNDVKHVLFKEKSEYYVVTNSSDFYYRNYLGQHILQDFVDEYVRNKNFITEVDENTWGWEWKFFTPIDESQRHSMRAEVTLDAQDYVEKIKLFSEDELICTFKFEFERINTFDFEGIIGGYERVHEVSSP